MKSNTHQLATEAWRCVAAESVASTLKLLDTVFEAQRLNQLLAQNSSKHPLIASPFEQRNYQQPSSRFRAQLDPGVFYCALDETTALLEHAWHRAKFARDSHGLGTLQALPMNLFSIDINATCIDLQKPPFEKHQANFTNQNDYTTCHEIAKLAREAKTQSIRYRSVRNQIGECLAIFDEQGIRSTSPKTQQAWLLNIFHDELQLIAEDLGLGETVIVKLEF